MWSRCCCVRLDLQGGTDALSRMRPSNFKKMEHLPSPKQVRPPKLNVMSLWPRISRVITDRFTPIIRAMAE